MRRAAFAMAATVALMVISMLTWTAQATTLSGTVMPSTHNYSPVEKVGCTGAGRCPYGTYLVCGPYGRHCSCAACGAAYGYHHYYHPYYRYNY